jgi:hypothetical protein
VERIANVVKDQSARDKDNFKKSLESSKVYLQKSFYNSILEFLKTEGEYIETQSDMNSINVNLSDLNLNNDADVTTIGNLQNQPEYYQCCLL